MEFTLIFIKLFMLSLYLVGPLLMFLTLWIIILGQIVTRIEKWNKFNGLYWSLITATTVGYGDINPTKKLSKVISIIIAFIGLVLTGIIIAVALKAASLSLERHADQQVIERIKAVSNR
ncbi:MAG: voltage-gated potassium channel Kch [Colwellia sp.]|jgi:voltage-gated potassium channel Kch|uniref:potassium channel family protein n=1 Tax=Colwellia sp. Bg11-12 TaxID=2759817 RepID=UPI0015F568B8|nr:potassium channel family protein [Colwellia sp. Bg11-12]MBA6263781.1 two pore domain potassium channel family protein [Colwellia sp. Bg11-12]